jgi:hypothetical protein
MPFLLLSSMAFLHTPALHAGLSGHHRAAGGHGMASAAFRRGDNAKITVVRVLATEHRLAAAEQSNRRLTQRLADRTLTLSARR